MPSAKDKEAWANYLRVNGKFAKAGKDLQVNLWSVHSDDKLTLYHGDSQNVLTMLPVNSIDLVVTDPPYFMEYLSKRVETRDNFYRVYEGDKLVHIPKVRNILWHCGRVMKRNTAIYCFSGARYLDFYTGILKLTPFKFKNLIVWDKGIWTAGDLTHSFGSMTEFVVYANKGQCLLRGKRFPNIWRYPVVRRSERLHPLQKPVDLIIRMIESSSDKGDTVLDPFMGSGSIGEACLRTGRRFIGIEIDQLCYKIALKRLC